MIGSREQRANFGCVALSKGCSVLGLHACDGAAGFDREIDAGARRGQKRAIFGTNDDAPTGSDDGRGRILGKACQNAAFAGTEIIFAMSCKNSRNALSTLLFHERVDIVQARRAAEHGPRRKGSHQGRYRALGGTPNPLGPASSPAPGSGGILRP